MNDNQDASERELEEIFLIVTQTLASYECEALSTYVHNGNLFSQYYKFIAYLFNGFWEPVPVTSLAKWAQQFQHLTQSRQQLNAMSGSRGMGSLLNNPSVNAALPADWQQRVTSVRSTAACTTERQRHPTFPKAPKATAFYDTIGEQNVTSSDLYQRSNERMTQVQSLMGQIENAEDPAAKADLTNRLVSEQNAIQANQKPISVLRDRQAAGAGRSKPPGTGEVHMSRVQPSWLLTTVLMTECTPSVDIDKAHKGIRTDDENASECNRRLASINADIANDISIGVGQRTSTRERILDVLGLFFPRCTSNGVHGEK
jgi:hypothetical protein